MHVGRSMSWHAKKSECPTSGRLYAHYQQHVSSHATKPEHGPPGPQRDTHGDIIAGGLQRSEAGLGRVRSYAGWPIQRRGLGWMLCGKPVVIWRLSCKDGLAGVNGSWHGAVRAARADRRCSGDGGLFDGQHTRGGEVERRRWGVRGRGSPASMARARREKGQIGGSRPTRQRSSFRASQADGGAPILFPGSTGAARQGPWVWSLPRGHAVPLAAHARIRPARCQRLRTSPPFAAWTGCARSRRSALPAPPSPAHRWAAAAAR